MNKPKNPYDESWLIRHYSQERYKNSVYLPEQEFVGRQNGWQDGADAMEAYKDEYFEAFRQEQNKEFQALKRRMIEGLKPLSPEQIIQILKVNDRDTQEYPSYYEAGKLCADAQLAADQKAVGQGERDDTFS